MRFLVARRYYPYQAICMNARLLYYLMLSLLLTACPRESAGDPPVDVERLSKAVADLHLAEGLVGEISVTLQDSMKMVYGKNVVNDHGYTVEEFREQMWIIRSEPEWMEQFFILVSDELAKIEAESSRVPPQLEE